MRSSWRTLAGRKVQSLNPDCGTVYDGAPRTQAKDPATLTCDDECDPAPYAISLNARIEGAAAGGRHVISGDTTKIG
jgi:hypothetical protein